MTGARGMQTVAEWIAVQSIIRGEQAAIMAPDRPALSYRQLGDQIRQAGERLRQAGIRRGDVVLIAMPDGPEALTAILTVAAVATAFPVAALEQAEEYERIIREVNVVAVLTTDRPNAPINQIAARQGIMLIQAVGDLRRPAGLFDLRVKGPRDSVADEAPGLDDPAILVGTSGATSAPKIVAATHRSLYASLDHFGEWLGLDEHDRSLSVMPLFHMHGLARSTLPGLLRGGQVVCAPGFDQSRVLGWMKELQPTYMSAAPSLYRALLKRVDGDGWQAERYPLRFLAIGSDRVDATTLAELEEVFRVPICQFYGLTEAAPLVAVSPRGQRLPVGAIGRINPVWSVHTLDESGEPLPAGADGEIAITGGYLNPIVGRTGGARQRRTRHGWLLTGDRGHVDAEGFLFLSGRIGDRIHRGGEKILPENIENALLQHPAVREAVAFPIADQILGERVGAIAVPVEGRTITEDELKAHAARHLAAFKVPERIVVADRVPVSSTGKVARASLAAELGLTMKAPQRRASQPSGLTAPSFEQMLGRLFRRQLGLQVIDPAASFFDLGGDSIGATELLLEIEEVIGISVPPATFLQNCSVSALAGLLEGKWKEIGEQMLVPLRTSGSLPPLFVPHALNGAVGYARALSDALGADQPIYTFHSRPLQADRNLPCTVEATAARYVAMLCEIDPRGPYFLLGYSVGAHFALEMAQHLAARGKMIAFLGVIDDEADLNKRCQGAMKRKPVRGTVEIDNLWTFERYVPRPYPGRITLFRAEDGSWTRSDPLFGWGDLAYGGIECHDVPGDHSTVVSQPNMLRWGARLAACLAKARHAAFADEALAGARWKAAAEATRRIGAVGPVFHTIEARRAGKDGDLPSEIRSYRRAIALDADQPAWVYSNLAAALAEHEEADAAVEAYGAAACRDPWPLPIYIEVARILQRTGRAPALADLQRRAQLLEANNPAALRQLSNFHEVAGNLAEAEAVMLRALDLAPDSAELNIHVARISARAGKEERAVEYARKAERLSPDNAFGLQLLARLEAKLGKLDEAEAAYRRALDCFPVFAETALELSNLLDRRGKRAQAIEFARMAMELAPQREDFAFRLVELSSGSLGSRAP